MDRDEVKRVVRTELRALLDHGSASLTEWLIDDPSDPIPEPPPIYRGAISSSDLDYLGYFHLEDKPKIAPGKGPRLGYGGMNLALVTGTDTTLYTVGHPDFQEIAGFDIAGILDELGGDPPTAQQVTPWWDPIAGKRLSVLPEGLDKPVLISGLASGPDNRLHWCLQVFYNVANLRWPALGSSSFDPDNPDPTEPRELEGIDPNAYAGYLVQYRDEILCGQVTPQGITTTSWGPALFRSEPGLTPEDRTILFYPQSDPLTINAGHQPEDYFHPGVDGPRCGVYVPGRGIVFFGRVSSYQFKLTDNYRNGDPTRGDCNTNRGYHAPPYKPWAWSYDQARLEQRENTRDEPSHTWEVPIPQKTCESWLTGAAYDPDQRVIYVIQPRAYRPRMEPMPVVHVFRIAA